MSRQFMGVSQRPWARVMALAGGILAVVGLMASGCSKSSIPKKETASTTAESTTAATSGATAVPLARLGPVDEAQKRRATEFSTAVLNGKIEVALAMTNEAFRKSPGEKGLKLLAAVLSDYGQGQFAAQSAASLGDGLSDVVGHIKFADGSERTAHVVLRGDQVEAFTVTK